MILITAYGPKHRKTGTAGAFTILTPEDYKPRHRGAERDDWS